MISDIDYAAWLDRGDKKEVFLFDIQGKNTSGDAIIIRLSTAPYKKHTHIYHPRVAEFENSQLLEPSISGVAKIEASTINATNIDEYLDSWLSNSYSSITALHGDQSWDKSEFREVASGTIEKCNADAAGIEFVWSNSKRSLNKKVKPADYTFDGTDLLATAVEEYITENGEISSFDSSNKAAFNIKFPYNSVTTIDSEGENLLELIERVLSGLPGGLAFMQDGTAYIAELVKPTGSSPYRAFKPSSQPTIELIYPVGKIILKYDSTETEYEDTGIQDDYPESYRTLELEVSISSQTERDLLGAQLLALYNVVFQRVEFDTFRPISNIKLGDEIQLLWSRYGFISGKYGIVTSITKRNNNINSIGAWFEQ